jgi:FMN phosphatase YigB (HAD superfamily)
MTYIAPPRTGICFDLDHCLYRDPPNMADIWHHAFYQASQDFNLGLTEDQCFQETHHGSKQHGNAVRHFHIKYGVNRDQFLETCYSHVDEKVIPTCPETTRILMANRHIPMIIVTSGARAWAERVVPHLGLGLVFPPNRIIAIEDSDGHQKSHSIRPYEIAADRLGIPLDHLIMVDDHPKNLKTAHSGGKITVHITHGVSTGWEDHVHHQIVKAIDVFDLIHRGQIPWDGPVVTPRTASPRFLAYSPGL